jgi:5'(3')-deoxyribonucleotidase
MNHKGLRFNKGKLRYDLVQPNAHEEMVKVLTFGAEKYEDRNWEKGMSWSNVIASLKRHIAAIEKGEDYDEESGLLHAAHVACNAHFLTAYYKIYPQGDDRPHKYLNPLKIGLDIDEVLADWVGYWCNYHNIETPKFWNFDKDIKEKFLSLKDNKDFWLNIPVKTHPDEIPFEPHCYITARSIPKKWTEEWLQLNNFPAVPVYSVDVNTSKVEACKESGIDIFIDDRYENFIELNRAGICTYLWDAPHNQRYNVGYKRIFDFSNFK